MMLKSPRTEIFLALIFFAAGAAWIHFSHEWSDAGTNGFHWSSEVLLELGLMFLLAVLLFLVVRFYRNRLSDSSRQYHLLFEASPLPMYLIDAETRRFMLVNEAMVQKYGYSREELYRMTAYDIRPAEEHGRLDEYMVRMQEGLQEAGVWLHRKKNGELFHVQVRTNRFGYHNRHTYVVLADDISELLEKEKEISRLSLVARNTINGIIITGADRQIEWVNDAFTRMTGYTLEEARGKYPTSLLHGPATDKKEEEKMIFTVRSGQSYSGEILNYRKDGSELWVQTTISPLNIQGEATKHVAIFLDINMRKQQERQIAEQNARLREIAFASSHLIRAPLANILGLAELVNDNPAELKEIAAYLKVSAHKLDEVVKQMVKQATQLKSGEGGVNEER